MQAIKLPPGVAAAFKSTQFGGKVVALAQTEIKALRFLDASILGPTKVLGGGNFASTGGSGGTFVADEATLRQAIQMAESKGVDFSKVLGMTGNEAAGVKILIKSDDFIRAASGTNEGAWAAYALEFEGAAATGVRRVIYVAEGAFEFGPSGVASALTHEVFEMRAIMGIIRSEGGAIGSQMLWQYTRRNAVGGRLTPHGWGRTMQNNLFPRALPE